MKGNTWRPCKRDLFVKAWCFFETKKKHPTNEVINSIPKSVLQSKWLIRAPKVFVHNSLGNGAKIVYTVFAQSKDFEVVLQNRKVIIVKVTEE